jgi:hypothetical protein
LAYGFRSFSPAVASAGSVAFRQAAKQGIIIEKSHLPHGCKEAKRSNRNESGIRYTLQKHPLTQTHHHHNQPPLIRPRFPQFHHLPVVYPDFESIGGLNHWLSQSPQDPITSTKPIS